MKNESGLTPMMQQYLAIKEQCGDAILFYRMGDFYEMFYNDALVASRILGLALTTRDKGKENPIPMCGVPFHSATTYISRLLNAGYNVAVCEQAGTDSSSRGLMRREVVRVITPGTVLEDEHLQREMPNYLMAIWRDGNTPRIGLAFLDVSTGDFRATEVSSPTRLASEIRRVSPSEIISHDAFEGLEGCTVTRPREPISLPKARQILMEHFRTVTLDGFGLKGADAAVAASGMVLDYVRNTFKETLGHISAIRFYNTDDYMMLGPTTARNLELFESIAGGRKDTLFSVLNHTRTPMGARMLADWMAFPLVDAEGIRRRLDAVEELMAAQDRLVELREKLSAVPDLARISGRICAATAGPRDLRALGEGLCLVPQIKSLLDDAVSILLVETARDMDPLEGVRDRICATLVETPPLRLGEAPTIAEGVDAELDELRALRRDSRQWIAAMEARERETSGISNLKIGYNKVFGYYIELSKAQAAKAPPHFIRKQTLVNAERFITPELKEYEARLLNAEDAIATIERGIFDDLRRSILPHMNAIQTTVRMLARLDALVCLAWAARMYGYTRPEITDDRRIEIVAGRHPVVERVLRPGEYVPNPCCFDPERDTIHLITGPNMSGKSTYMRQVALICLMAQMGSFVPATKASIGIADRIFTRIGALDNLSAGQSTFLVEMSETADILHNATPRSLVILDEIGRGTSTYDGMALAWAVAEHLDEKRARTFFATHYHELADLSRRRKGIKNYHLAVEESGSEVIFLRTLKRGAVGRSFGIYVARLAGIPQAVVERARNLLEAVSARGRTVGEPARKAPVQTSLFEEGLDDLAREIASLDIESLTPLEALNILGRLREKARRDRRR